MAVGFLSLHFHIPGCASLKEKRAHLKPILARLPREYNLAVAELDYQDVWQDMLIGCVTISSDAAQARRLLQQAAEFAGRAWPDLTLVEHSIEML